jgi:hypothetical protein
MGGKLSGAFSIFPKESLRVLKKFSTKLETIYYCYYYYLFDAEYSLFLEPLLFYEVLKETSS